MMTCYADIQDLPKVAELCMLGLQELKNECSSNLDEEKLLDSIMTFWACAPCILLKKNDEIIGFYGLTTFKPFYSDDTVLGDYMLYIQPEHRSYKAARMLSIAARDVANKFKLVFDLNFITAANINTKARFLEGMGAKVIGVKGAYDGR
jgi:hypothetical protein